MRPMLRRFSYVPGRLLTEPSLYASVLKGLLSVIEYSASQLLAPADLIAARGLARLYGVRYRSPQDRSTSVFFLVHLSAGLDSINVSRTSSPGSW
jgi:hypothetical protein